MDKCQESSPSIDDKTFVAGINQTKTIENKTNLIGKCLKKRYLIESRIGHGGMSDIYRAKDLYLESLNVSEPFVAIKVLLSEFADAPEAQQVLIKESIQTQQLSHPNIIRVYDVDSDDAYHFMVMEWLDGETLEQVIKRSKPSGINFKGTMQIIEQIGSALSYAHKQGIVHTDLKPSNIFLTRKGDIKVFDFGVAKNFQQNVDQYALAEADSDPSLTGYTPAYASYEQLLGEEACAADDVFAFSCITYELLTSKHPYLRVAANEVDTNKQKLTKPKHLSFRLWLSLKKGLAIHKAQRELDIQSLITKFQSKSWPVPVSLAAAALIGVVGFQMHQASEQKIGDLENIISANEQVKNESNAYEFITASTLFEQIDGLPNEKSLIRDGLLRKHQIEVLDLIEKQIAAVPKSDNGLYQNYGQIELIIADISRYYPDSVRLLQINNQMKRSKQSVIDSLSDRLTVLLSQSRYNETGDNNIKSIVEGLAFVEPKFKYMPNEEALVLYTASFEQALKLRDVEQINALITTGEVVFSASPEAEPLLKYGASMRVAVKKLNDFNRDTESGSAAEYPYEAAEVFYRDTFKVLTEQLDLIDDPKKLHAFDKEVAILATSMPADFEPLLTLEKRLAASFLRQANIYLEKQYLKTARELFARGNELYERLNGVQRL